jgi:DNA-binding CsgD family transcriptional regulator
MPKPTLTPRELEVLELIARGDTSQQIGASLGITKRTVNAHAVSVVYKLGARNRTNATAIAMRLGLI